MIKRRLKQFANFAYHESVDGLRKRDAFGTPINVNYEGKSSYGTVFGGLVTLIISILLIYVFAHEY